MTWLYPTQGWPPNYFIKLEAFPGDADPDLHGSCVLSKAVGPNYGIAKKSDVVIVKLPSALNLKTGAKLPGTKIAAVLHGFELIEKDVKDNNKQGKAVINVSLGSRPHDDLVTILKRLIALDVVLVTLSGNHAVSQSIIKY